MKALLDFIPPNEVEGDSLGELQFDEIFVNWSKVTPEEYKKIQKQFHEIFLPNGETLEIKAQIETGNYIVLVRQDGQFLAQVSNSGSGSFAFRTLQGGIVGMSILES